MGGCMVWGLVDGWSFFCHLTAYLNRLSPLQGYFFSFSPFICSSFDVTLFGLRPLFGLTLTEGMLYNSTCCATLFNSNISKCSISTNTSVSYVGKINVAFFPVTIVSTCPEFHCVEHYAMCFPVHIAATKIPNSSSRLPIHSIDETYVVKFMPFSSKKNLIITNLSFNLV